jgi:hypothetical protein
MRLSSLGRDSCLAAAHFTLALAVILLFSSNTVAQHSGGGGSSGGSSSSGGGGGSHGGGSSGGSRSSGSSGGGHSSGGSGSLGSSGSSGGHASSSGSHSSHSGPSHSSHSGGTHSVREPNAGMRGKTGTEKRGFFSILRHPFRKPQPTPEPKTKLTAELRRPICFRGPCKVCPTGLARGGGCGGTIVATYARRSCPGRVWSDGTCFQESRFPYDCNAERVAMEQQAQRMHSAEAAQQSACSAGSGQDCTDRTSASQSEASRYRTLQAQYGSCQQRSMGVNPFGHSAGAGSRQGLSFDPFEFDLDYR